MESFGKSKKAKEENNEKTATEIMNLKITNAQMKTYTKEQRMPTLKELAEGLKEDEDIQYILETSKVAEVEYNVQSENPTVIYIKLKKYSYEFEINSQLEIIKIDGNKIEQTGSSSSNNIATSTGDFEIITPYIGTSAITVKINKETINEEINKYVYVIGNIIKEETAEEITIEELPENTQIDITVIAITKTNKQLVARKTIKTEPRTYLYNNGDQCTQLTGGWKTEALGIECAAAEPTLTHNTDSKCMNVYMTAPIDYILRGGVININNKINYKEYKKIGISYTATLGQYSGATVVNIGKNKNNPEIIYRMAYTSPIYSKTQVITNLSEVEDIFIYFQTCNNMTINCDIYEVWLEK